MLKGNNKDIKMVKGEDKIKVFVMTHKVFSNLIVEFPSDKPPLWLLSKEHKWWWEKHVLALGIGKSIESDFRRFTRIK